MTLGAPPATKVEDSFKLVAASTQASPQAATPDDTIPIDQTPQDGLQPYYPANQNC